MKEIQIYDGTVTLRFDPEAHKYEAKTETMESFLPVVGYSTVMGMKVKGFMGPWVAKMAREETHSRWKEIRACAGPDEDEMALKIIKECCDAWKVKRDTAANSGTIAHEWIERFLKGENLQYPEDESAAKAISAFERWWESHEIKVHAVEQMVFSKDYWYAGTFDLLAEINGVLTLADFKTSSNIYPDMGVQVSGAYRPALNEQSGILVDDCLIINIQKNGNLQVAHFNDHELNELEFRSLLNVYKANRDRPKPNIERIK